MRINVIWVGKNISTTDRPVTWEKMPSVINVMNGKQEWLNEEEIEYLCLYLIKYYDWIPISNTMIEYLYQILWLNTYIKYCDWIPISNTVIEYLYQILWLNTYIKYYDWIPISNTEIEYQYQILWLNTYIKYYDWIPLPVSHQRLCPTPGLSL